MAGWKLVCVRIGCKDATSDVVGKTDMTDDDCDCEVVESFS